MTTNASIERIRALAQEGEQEIIALRRHFHANAELSWEEVETSKRIAEELKKVGFENIRIGFGGTQCGVTAEISGAKGKCVALRADIDALPLSEENETEYRSKNKNVMHACGHDAHTASLLGAAKILAQIRKDLKGTVRLCFQPAEESGSQSGARVMLEEGALDGVDSIFGLHVFSNIPSGMVQYRSGPIMAAADGWELTITGKGGHGSAPEEAIDPTIAAFQMGNAFQSIISREVSPKDTAVLSVGGITTSSDVFNIIPERVTMKGTVRTFLPEVQDRVESAMERVTSSIAEACRCKAELKYMRFLPATVNTPELALLVQEIAEELFGAEHVEEAPLTMGSEDFSYYSYTGHIPAVFAFLGVGCPEKQGTTNPHHSPKFDLDEAQLYKASALYAAFAWKALENS
ncbi:MAG: amidohydrolase [Fretibacterium sp.]|nr:amidohydrolase [Fretibacterium sp.]